MNVPLSTAAAGALAVRPVPITTVSPRPSMSNTASVAVRDHGSCAPMSAHPIPSSSRCLARSTTSAGTSDRDTSATQVASLPVGPSGAVAAVTSTPQMYACYTYIITALQAQQSRCIGPMLGALMSVHDFRSSAEVTAGAGVPLHRQLFLVLHDEI